MLAGRGQDLTTYRPFAVRKSTTYWNRAMVEVLGMYALQEPAMLLGAAVRSGTAVPLYTRKPPGVRAFCMPTQASMPVLVTFVWYEMGLGHIGAVWSHSAGKL